MKKLIKEIPIPLAGVILGIAALGNLLQSYSEQLRLFCGALATIFLILYILKIVMFPKEFKENMKNPIMASVFATFPMALMILSVYGKPYIGQVAMYIWFLAILIHISLIIYFTSEFIIKIDVKKVFASYFIVYVGTVAASITAPAYGMENIGTLAFWFGFVSLLALLVLVTYRHLRHPEIPEPAQPLFCIFTAPTSLCLAGYLQSVVPKSTALVIFMAVLAAIIYLIVLFNLPKLLRLKFYPSYAAFTFPFVISAIATKMTMGYLAKIEMPLPFLKYVVLVQTIIATLFVIYATAHYMRYLYNQLIFVGKGQQGEYELAKK